MSAVVITSCVALDGAQQEKSKFVNQETSYNTSASNLWDITKAYVKAKRVAPTPTGEVPLKQLTRAELLQGTEDRIYRLGHSTVLMRLDGEFVITDPVFSDRASPVQWAGPKRFHPTPISIEELPPIKTVIISHDHYDHLDKAAVQQLASKVAHFVTPLKVGQHLMDWGIDPEKITELDWWQSVSIDQLTLVATPAQHFSGRGLLDRDQTLWASWVIQGQQSNLYFSGDGGYFAGFKEIGERYGPFDLTMIETGAYNELWADIHMMPEHSMQAHLDLNGKAMMPIHNGTFDLSLHDWHEPFERISDLAASNGVSLITPIFGEGVSIKQPRAGDPWWHDAALAATNEMVDAH